MVLYFAFTLHLFVSLFLLLYWNHLQRSSAESHISLSSDELILEKCIFSASFSSFLFRNVECCNNWVEILLFKQRSIDLSRNTNLHLEKKKKTKSEVTNIPSFWSKPKRAQRTQCLRQIWFLKGRCSHCKPLFVVKKSLSFRIRQCCAKGSQLWIRKEKSRMFYFTNSCSLKISQHKLAQLLLAWNSEPHVLKAAAYLGGFSLFSFVCWFWICTLMIFSFVT